MRLSEKARVIFSGFAYRATETELAGRNDSVTTLSKYMAIANVFTDVNIGIIKKRGTEANRLRVCTQKFPNRSVSHPPSQEPETAPNPKHANTIPASVMLKPRACVM